MLNNEVKITNGGGRKKTCDKFTATKSCQQTNERTNEEHKMENFQLSFLIADWTARQTVSEIDCP